MAHEYTEIGLGADSTNIFFRNAFESLGFVYNGPQSMRGRSGLTHHVDAVGMREGNLVLAFSGAQGMGKNYDDNHSPKQRVESWCRDALLRVYDIGAVLEAEGVKADLLLFENARNHPIEQIHDLTGWITDQNLPNDIQAQASFSERPIETVPPRYVSDIASSIGACFLSLRDLQVSEIGAISNTKSDDAVNTARHVLERLRVSQYFNPPTDELLLTAIALSEGDSIDIVPAIYEGAKELAHPPVQNVIVSDVDYTDPVATAVALQQHRLIDYEATVTIQEGGRDITYRIRKTPQENFVIRALNAIGLDQIARAIIEGLTRSEG